MYQRILVPLDGSPLAEGVLPHVQGLAQSLGAELVLLRVAFAHIVCVHLGGRVMRQGVPPDAGAQGLAVKTARAGCAALPRTRL